MILFYAFLYAQNHPPIAVNDTVEARVLDTTYFNLTANDYDPDGDEIKIIVVAEAIQHNDSIAYFYQNTYYKMDYQEYINYPYMIMDEHGLTGPESEGNIVVKLIDPFFETLNVNNVWAGINSYGNHFNDNNEVTPYYSYLFVPTDKTVSHLLESSSIWLAGVNENGDTVSGAEISRSRPGYIASGDFWSGPLSNDGACHTNLDMVRKWRRTWKVTRQEVINHVKNYAQPDYDVPDNILNWPAHGDPAYNQDYFLAPFVDVNDNRIYEPMKGDFPLIRGDASIFFIFNDISYHMSCPHPVGMEVHGMAFAYADSLTSAWDNSIFISYKIINRSDQTLHNAFASVYTSFSVSWTFDEPYYSPNNYIGCDVERGSYFGYCLDPPPWIQDTLMAQAVVVLGGPDLDADQMDNPSGGCDASITGLGFGDGIVDNERYGMTSFNYFNWYKQNNKPWSYPSLYYDYYNAMQSRWQDGVPLQYGGNGYPTHGAYGPECRFAFPGLSDPSNWGTGGEEPNGPQNWTDVNGGNPPSTRSGVASMGPFTLEPGEVNYIDVAYVSAYSTDGEPPLDQLMDYVDTIRARYRQNTDNFGYEWLDVKVTPATKEQISIYPNPSKDLIYLKSENSFGEEIQYFIYDLVGNNSMQGRLKNSDEQSINISKLKPGFYLLRIRGEDYQAAEKFILK